MATRSRGARGGPVKIDFDQDELQPIIEAAVRETIAQVDADRQKLPAGRLAFPEAEAAALLGIPGHSLRDCRRRGEIKAVKLGARIAYTRESVLEFLVKQRIE